MEGNNQNQQNNNDLDSLLKEFQKLSEGAPQPATNAQQVTPVQPVSGAQQVTPVQPVSGVQQVTPAQPVNGAQQVTPVQPVSGVQQVTPAQPVSGAQQVTPVQPPLSNQIKDIPVTQNVATNGMAEIKKAPVPQQPEIQPNNNASDPVPPVVEDNNNKEATEQNTKNSNLFIIAIFVLIGIFIFFIPKISDFFSNRHKIGTKPVSTPTATPVQVAKERKLECEYPGLSGGDGREIQLSGRYYYKGDKLVKYEEEMVASLETMDAAAIEELKTQCADATKDYEGIAGYEVICEVNKSSQVMTSKYDLEHFVNPTEISNGTLTLTIELPDNYQDTLEEVKAAAEADGAVCK